MKKKTLSKKEIKELNSKLEQFGYSFDKKEYVEKIEDDPIYYRSKDAVFFIVDGQIIPSLKLLLQEKCSLKKITVDMGAVKFVCNGADIMRPGIVDIEESIEEGQFIQIIDENNKKPLAVGKTLFTTEDMRGQKEGKSIKNIHYVGDLLWNLSKN